MYALGFPRLYIQGIDVFDTIGEQIKKLGSNPLIVTDAFVLKLFGERLEKSLSQAGIKGNILEFKGECSPSQIDILSEKAKNFNTDVIVGVGGGKSLDIAKAVALSCHSPMVIVPTIASNDAPTSRVIVTYTDDGAFIGPRFLTFNPDIIIVDTEIVAKAPPRFFASGIADALATWFEAEQCLKSNAVNFFKGKQLTLATHIARTCYETIMQDAVEAMNAVRKQQVTPAVERVVEANVLLSGLGFEGCGVAAAHGIGLALSVLPEVHGILHGEEVALGILCQLALEGRADSEIYALHAFYKNIDLPFAFEQVGITDFTEAKLQAVANEACKPTSRIWNMSAPVSHEKVINAIKHVEALGKTAIKK